MTSPSDADTPLTAEDPMCGYECPYPLSAHRAMDHAFTLDATRAVPGLREALEHIAEWGACKRDADEARAALSQPPATPGIDVERLAMALAAEDGYTDLEVWRKHDGQIEWATRIAAEYDRLALADKLAAGGET